MRVKSPRREWLALGVQTPRQPAKNSWAKLGIVLTKNLVKTGKAAAATRMVGKSHFPEKPGYFYFLWKIPLGYPQPFLQNVGLTGLDRRKRYSHSQLWD